MEIANTITIQRQVHDVFAYLARFENIPQWNYAISETRPVTPGPVGVGSKYAQHRTVPTDGEESFEVTGYQPDRMLSIKGVFGPLPTEATYTLEGVGDGATALTNVMRVEPKGLSSLLAPLAAPRLKAAVADNLASLRQILEGAS